jgi:site-specific DNA recombinase
MGTTTAAKYRRISDDREGRELGIARQDADLDALADQRGYQVVASYTDNDIGASTRSTKPRPDYDRMLADARAGRFDVILAYTSSRLTRRPIEHEGQIELAERHGVRFEYVRSPSFDLNTADGRQVARMLAAQDAAESERISERVQRARLAQAMQGRPSGGGRRPYGFEADGVTVRPAESAEIVKAADALLSGVSLRHITLDLRERHVATVTGAQWSTRTLRDILLRPRNAGLIVHRGEVLEGVEAPWQPMLSRDVWHAVTALLTDPSRRTSPGNTPRWLGSGIYYCGHPSHPDGDRPTMRVGSSVNTQHRTPRYTCRETQHLTRSAPALDKYVGKVIAHRLARKDAADLLTPPEPGVDHAKLTRDAEALRRKLREARRLWRDDVFTDGEYRVERAELQARLTAVEERQRAASGRDPLAGIAGRADAAEVWERLGLGRQRAILDALVIVTVLPQRLGRLPDGSRFDPHAVRIGPAAPSSAPLTG